MKALVLFHYDNCPAFTTRGLPPDHDDIRSGTLARSAVIEVDGVEQIAYDTNKAMVPLYVVSFMPRNAESPRVHLGQTVYVNRDSIVSIMPQWTKAVPP